MSESKKYPASSAEVLLKRIHAAFPELNWDSYQLVSVGWDHEVIILDSKIVFRFPNDAAYAASLRSEIEVLQRLKPLTSMAIPQYSFIAPDYSFAGYPLIPGQVLEKKLFDELAAGQRCAIAEQLAGFLTVMHTQNESGFAAVLASYLPSDQAEVKQLSSKHLTQVLNQADLQIVGQILTKVDALLSQTTPTVLIHGDVYSQHLLWDDSASQLGLIDFSDMARGDPAIDFAELYEYCPDFVNQVYECYTGPKDDTFLERAWLYQQWVGVYMMTDHFVYHKTSFEIARQTFDRVKNGAK